MAMAARCNGSGHFVEVKHSQLNATLQPPPSYFFQANTTAIPLPSSPLFPPPVCTSSPTHAPFQAKTCLPRHERTSITTPPTKPSRHRQPPAAHTQPSKPTTTQNPRPKSKMESMDVENGGSSGKSKSNGWYPFGRSGEEAAITGDEREWTSWVVPLFVVANVAVFVAAMWVNDCPSSGGYKCVASFLGRLSFQPLRENPLLGPSSRTLEKMGSLQWEKVVHQNQGWRLITCIWLHAGVIHLLANMLSLVFIGIRLEQQFGFLRIVIIYLISGFGGSVLSSLFIRTSISVGASGALFGLLGAMLSELITNWTIYSNKAAAISTLLIIILINLGVGVLPHIDNFAHIGGFLSGFLLGFVFLLRAQFAWMERHNLPPSSRAKSKYMLYQIILCCVALVFLIIWFTAGLAMLFKGRNLNDQCHWCHHLSCIPTSRWDCGN